MRKMGIPLACLVINACTGLLAIQTPDVFAYYKLPFFLFSIIALVTATSHLRDAFLYQFRFLFLAAIGYFAGFAKILDNNLAFSPVEPDLQTLAIGAAMYGMTSIALLGAFLGLVACPVADRPQTRCLAYRPWPWRALFTASALAVAITGYLSARSYGPLVWEGVYGMGEGEGQLLGNLQAMGVIFLTLNFIAAHRLKSRPALVVAYVLSFYFLAWSILFRGGRLEFLSGLLSLLICYQAAHGKSVRVGFKYYVALLAAAVLMEAWGYVRTNWAGESSESMLQMYIRLYDAGMIFAGTASGIATTFSNLLDMVNKGVVDFQWGRSYVDYLLRTPPEFLYPSRPKDLSLIFLDYGYYTVGGFFELAEAYFNFGIAGVFFVPMAISFCLGKIYTRALRGHTFSFFLLMGVTSIFLRGAWYQTFAYYKGMVTSALLFVLVWLFIQCLAPASRDGRHHSTLARQK